MIAERFQDFVRAAQDLGILLGEQELRLFTLYDEGLRLWNKKMNLVSERDEEQLPMRHFLDALTPVPFLPREALHILDIGSGAGLPGIPMKIAVDAWRLSLLEASRKRTSFLKDIVRKLALQDVTVIHDRTEALVQRKQGQGGFDVVISRATFKLPQLIETAAYFLRLGGTLVAMKGHIPESEWSESVQISDNVHLSLKETHEIRFPFGNMPRKIIIYNKYS